jgi:hypothetical protein
VGQGQDPYGDAGGFTPYQPDATPDDEPPADSAPAPFVPYGGGPAVPYGSAGPAAVPTVATSATAGRRILPWVVGIGVLLASCGGGLVAIVGSFVGGSDSAESPDGSQVYVNDLKAGECLIGAGFATDEPVSKLEIVDCSTAHDAQVLDVNVLDSNEAAAYDFDDPGSSGRACNPVLSGAQLELVRGRDYGLVAFTETGNPAQGDKVACLVKRADGAPIREFLPAASPEQPA